MRQRRPGFLDEEERRRDEREQDGRRGSGDEPAEDGVAEAQALLMQRLRLAHSRRGRGGAHYLNEIGIFTSGLPSSVILLSCDSDFCCRILPIGA